LKILVSGASGFLGKHTVSLFNSLKYNYIKILRGNITSKNEIFCDLSSKEQVLKILNEIRPDVIVNLAAKPSFSDIESDEMFKVNVELVELMANFCKSQNVHLIHSSGTIVHGFHHKLYNIKTPLEPRSEYGRQKLLAEKEIINSNCKYTIIRFGGIFGYKGPRHLGLNQSIENALSGIPPELNGTGNSKRNYVFAKDAAKAIEYCLKNKKYGIFYSGGEILTIKKMLETVCEVLLPSAHPLIKKGKDTHDQVIEVSSGFSFMNFKEALQNLK